MTITVFSLIALRSEAEASFSLFVRVLGTDFNLAD
jgi:hypothetical protein